MAILENLTGAAGTLLGGLGKSPVAKSMLDRLEKSGALPGLVQAFEKVGLGHIAGSWVGTGQNAPVSPQDVQKALGPQVEELAKQHGQTSEAVSSTLSKILPGLVDHLTPSGHLPSAAALSQIVSSLRSKLGF